jgi:hypothetical protein
VQPLGWVEVALGKFVSVRSRPSRLLPPGWAGTKLRLVLPCHLRRPLAAVLLLCCALAVASCGGEGSNKEDVQDLLDRAFRQEIRSGELKVDAQIQVKGGTRSTDRPVHIRATGPFHGNNGKLPSVDLELEIGSDGGQTVQTGFLTTGDRAFVRFQDVNYEEPASVVRKANDSLRRSRGRRSSLSSLGLDPRSWLADAKEKGEEKVAGVNVEHVSGTLDVGAVMSDLNEFIKRSGSAIGGATGEAKPKPLTGPDIDKITRIVKNPTFDVYVGKDDEIVRRVSGRVEVTVPKRDRVGDGGLEGGSLEFSIEFRKVNTPQKIVAPAKARPLAELTRSLGASALGDLGQLGGGSGSNGDGGGGDSQSPPASTTPDDAQGFKEYADCLEKAKPGDTTALQSCALLLPPAGGSSP